MQDEVRIADIDPCRAQHFAVDPRGFVLADLGHTHVDRGALGPPLSDRAAVPGGAAGRPASYGPRACIGGAPARRTWDDAGDDRRLRQTTNAVAAHLRAPAVGIEELHGDVGDAVAEL